MSTLEALQPNASVRGILPDCLVTVVSVQWFGSEALELTYKNPAGRVANELLYRHDEARLDVVEEGRPWSFDGDGHLFRLVSEAHRIRLAHLFDPVLAVHTSLVEPLPHQITAVYEAMLPRQPLRFLLADDPGAGKTIMAGLLIKELIVRGDLQRCLVVCPGSLAEQWQDELYRRFQLPFDILTNDKLEAARTGNWFLEHNLVIARLDKLSRNEDVQQKLQAPDCRWDLVVCDEAHKLSATFFGGEIKYTRRYKLGQLLAPLTRHFLLMTATPHNGKEEDFQLFLALLDGDRFEGRFRDGVHQVEVSDLMRRMVKENLCKFDGTPLFPERIAHTVPYRLSDAEAQLYKAVTDYVREEFNRAEALQNDKRAGTVGFALTILQRRLASSPEAIYQSLRRRRERLEKRCRELELLQRGAAVPSPGSAGVSPAPEAASMAALPGQPALDAEDIEDLEEAPDHEVEAAEAEILDQATAARTIDELKAEIATLGCLEALAGAVRRGGEDRKWRELAGLLSIIFTPAAIANQVAEDPAPYGAGTIPPPTSSPRQKLVIFTEHRDTLSYLDTRVSTLLGHKEAVVVIHGGMGREERLKAQESFRHDPDVQVLLATDAAGEGINLQRAHLMVNYDLPWNPNRLEQRFGRIHRIGQTEVCHLWNLVAEETREGDVYRTLLDKLEQARQALGGQVFDVLGKLQFEGRPLRDLLLEAIRYGERPEVRARLTQAIASAVDRPQLQALIEERALAHDAMDVSRVARVREEMERAEARRLQPHYIESFFLEAFKQLGGTVRQREPRRYEVTHVPAPIRHRDRLIGIGEPVLPRYERIVFEKTLIAPPGQPLAAFVCPGHPLLDATLDLTLERHRDLLRRGTVLVDDRDPGTAPRVLFYLEHALQDASSPRSGERRAISKRLLYIEISPGSAGVSPASCTFRHLHYAPYLDYRPLRPNELDIDRLLSHSACAWITRDLGQQAVAHAIAQVVPQHLQEIRGRRLAAAATYLYQDGPRYWYSTQPTVTKLAEDRAEQLKRDPDKVVHDLDQRLCTDRAKKGDFNRVHPLPGSSADVPDDLDARLVVLGVDHAYSREPGSAAEMAAKAILETRGGTPRLYRNALVFLAADKARLQDLDEAVRTYLAWTSILSEKELLDLSPHQVRQAETQQTAADSTVTARLPETYQWLLVPTQTNPQAAVAWQAIRLTGQEALAVRAIKKLRNDELLVTSLGATRLRLEMDRIPLWRGDHVAIKQLVDDFRRYFYLPRLKEAAVLLGAIRDGCALLTWEQDAFAYAESYDEAAQRYRGLRYGQHIAVTDDNTGLLVRPEVARRQIQDETDKYHAPEMVLLIFEPVNRTPQRDSLVC